MWNDLPIEEKNEYKKMILAFASLTEAFAQKAEDADTETLSPIINSKFQETVFQKAFGASAEDVGNTSYDAAMCKIDSSGISRKYLIGIKTFGIATGDQKIAQFKAYHDEWSSTLERIRRNSLDDNNRLKSKEEIDEANKNLYFKLAGEIADLRNMRIRSSEANIRGFNVTGEDVVETVYHVLMPSKKGDEPCVYVGETNYSQINKENISIIGCTSERNPTNFDFYDGIHKYRFTSADSQLLMNFDNNNIVQEKWEVIYLKDAYKFFSELGEKIYQGHENVKLDEALETVKTSEIQVESHESYSWLITNKDNEVEPFSGFNSFFGVGSKLSTDNRKGKIINLKRKYEGILDKDSLNAICESLTDFLLSSAPSKENKIKKISQREEILESAKKFNNPEFESDIKKFLYRPKSELYIPLPNSKEFHKNHPDFFAKSIWDQVADCLIKDKERRRFNLVFEPSGKIIPSYITQSDGKAIQSYEKQSYLGDWILKEIFQLREYEPLTTKRLNEVGINGIRVSKDKDTGDIHLYFIWIDKEDLPDDYIKSER